MAGHHGGGGSVVLGTRPEWTRTTLGIPLDTIVRVHPGAVGAKPDLSYSRNRVSVSRVPGAAARPEDEFDVGYVYGPESTNQDVAARSLLPLLRKLVDGYNVAVLAFGATGSGKTLLMEGSSGKERHSPEGGGLVHLAVDELFRLLGEKAVAVGSAVAEKRRLPSARAFDFFLETSFAEVHDLYARPEAVRAPLQVYEDLAEGWQVSGLTARIAKSSAEMRTHFNAGRLQRDSTKEDVGPVHERASAVFTISLAQYAPAAVPGEEDRMLFSRIQFVDLPGSERLAEDPEVLRLREGPLLNRSLHAFGAALRSLAEGPGGGLQQAAVAAAAAAAAAATAAGGGGRGGAVSGAGGMLAGAGAGGGGGGAAAGGYGGGALGLALGAGVPFVNYEASVLTKLLADALGGNALTLLCGTLRQADGSSGLHAINTLQYLTFARAAKNFPIINHGRARGLVQKLRQRLMAVVDDRQVLREIMDSTPAVGDPNANALNIAKIRDMEARLMAARSENAALVEEKEALQARLSKLYQAEEGDLQEKVDMQNALIQSEEQRLQLSRALIDLQMEMNEAKQEWEAAKHALEVKLVEAEAQGMEAAVAAEQLAEAAEVEKELEKKSEEAEALSREVARLRSALDSITAMEAGAEGEGAGAGAEDSDGGGPASPLGPAAAPGAKPAGRGEGEREGEGEPEIRGPRAEPAAGGGAGKKKEGQGQEAEAPAGRADDPASRAKDRVRQLKKKAEESKQKERRIQELQGELAEQRRELDALRNGVQLKAAGVDELKAAGVDEVREASRRKLEVMQADVADMARVVKIMKADPDSDLRLSPDEIFAALSNLAAENTKVAEAREADMRAEVADMAARHLELKRKYHAICTAHRNLRYLLEDRWPPSGGPPPRAPTEEEVVGAALEGLDRDEEEADQRTIHKLRERVSELESLLASTRLAQAAADHGASTGHNPAAVPLVPLALNTRDMRASKEVPRHVELENAKLREELDAMRRKLKSQEDPAVVAAKAGSGSLRPAAAAATHEAMLKQLREHNAKTSGELQRKAQSAESRAAMAEEQLAQLQAYMAKASVSYQKEIVRLRSVIGQMEVSMGVKQGTYLNMSPLEGSGGAPGTTLRPAAEVLDEMMSRGSALLRPPSVPHAQPHSGGHGHGPAPQPAAAVPASPGAAAVHGSGGSFRASGAGATDAAAAELAAGGGAGGSLRASGAGANGAGGGGGGGGSAGHRTPPPASPAPGGPPPHAPSPGPGPGPGPGPSPGRDSVSGSDRTSERSSSFTSSVGGSAAGAAHGAAAGAGAGAGDRGGSAQSERSAQGGGGGGGGGGAGGSLPSVSASRSSSMSSQQRGGGGGRAGGAR
ncbi:hypothetical protein HYH03_015577 [Edaphochlamys debaryana]|uniref:Kinesin motor domain-containing protein n=1 Tax=Edaphochlamys debaryana TaxID=47281 RepID=A0A835XLV8_9CHLO|nr:hypothetical protein HYH03_015577 [Edaphochlamys debaryana]|eukprot:KAG2485692.1 hypothetical protein HYH03_015577 [Edaphochlamys debaryana]